MVIGYLLFRTHILSNFHFNNMSDGVLYGGFRIMQALLIITSAICEIKSISALEF